MEPNIKAFLRNMRHNSNSKILVKLEYEAHVVPLSQFNLLR